MPTALSRVVVPMLMALAMTASVLSPATPAHADPVAPDAAPSNAGAFEPVAPVRLLDTRTGAGLNRTRPLAPMEEVTLSVAGLNGVPGNASAVILNVTVTDPQAPGWVAVYPATSARPTISNLNYVRGQTVPNLVVATLGTNGAIKVFSHSGGTTHVIADLAGYYVGGTPTATGTFKALTPSRILDTRSNGGPVGPNATRDLKVTGGNVPADAQAVFVNITVTEPQTSGYVTAYPKGEERPNASNLNFVAGQTVPNLALVRVGHGGQVSLFNFGAGSSHIIVDIAGYVLGGSGPSEWGAFVPLAAPVRLFDTRTQPELRDGHAKLPSGYEIVPTFDPEVGGIVANVTVTEPDSVGFVSVFPRSAEIPNASNLNFVAGQTVPNLVVSAVDSDGQVSFLNRSGSPIHLLADMSGFYVKQGFSQATLSPASITQERVVLSTRFAKRVG